MRRRSKAADSIPARHPARTRGASAALRSNNNNRRARSAAAESKRVRAIADTLEQLYPQAHCELDFRTPFQLLVATILSAQCTDKRVNLVTPTLFARYPNPAALAAAAPGAVAPISHSPALNDHTTHS